MWLWDAMFACSCTNFWGCKLKQIAEDNELNYIDGESDIQVNGDEDITLLTANSLSYCRNHRIEGKRTISCNFYCHC